MPDYLLPFYVSTHSHPKVAGGQVLRLGGGRSGFNTQPPEGGWKPVLICCFYAKSFNTQPPEGGWRGAVLAFFLGLVSTHSHPKVAGFIFETTFHFLNSFNTQPPEGGWGRRAAYPPYTQSFNTQPPEGGWRYADEALDELAAFQHTATRRWLEANPHYCR